MNCPHPIRFVIMIIAVGLLPHGSFGNETGHHEDMIRRIEDTLIAPCCWNQPISQHFSSVSEQIRREVREMAEAGMSRDAILDHYVAIYGERILAAPRPRGFNLLAYILPWTALLFGGVILVAVLRKRLRPIGEAVPMQKPDSPYDELIQKELKDLDK